MGKRYNNPDWRGHFDVTDVDLRLIVQTAYSGSRPQGLGYLHHKPGGLNEDQLNQIMEQSEKYGGVDIDYLNGRSMKFHIYKDDTTGRLYFDLDWYDHGREASEWLMREIGLPDVERAIKKARAEKDEKAAEWEALKDKSAREFVKLVCDSGGAITEEKTREIYWDENHPLRNAVTYGPHSCQQNGWIVFDRSKDSYCVTDAGRKLVA